LLQRRVFHTNSAEYSSQGCNSSLLFGTVGERRNTLTRRILAPKCESHAWWKKLIIAFVCHWLKQNATWTDHWRIVHCDLLRLSFVFDEITVFQIHRIDDFSKYFILRDPEHKQKLRQNRTKCIKWSLWHISPFYTRRCRVVKIFIERKYKTRRFYLTH